MPRRGENIRKRKDGRWEGRYIKGRDSHGKAQYGYVYRKSYKEVKEALQQCVKIASAKSCTGREMPFEVLLQLWLDSAKFYLKQSTYSHYQFIIDRHILPFLGSIASGCLNQKTLESFLRGKLEHGRLDGRGGLSPKMVRDIIAVMKTAIRYGVENEWIDDPHLHVKLPRCRETERQILTMQDQMLLERYLLSAPCSCSLGILLCLYSGLRLGELCALQWKDLDLQNGVIHVRRTILRTKNPELPSSTTGNKTVLLMDTPKSAASQRDIPLSLFLLPLLESIKPLADENAYFLTGKQNVPMEPRRYQNIFQRYLLRCGIASINFHSLRHSFASRCLLSGFDLKTLSEILGHSSASITINQYVHTSMEDKKMQMLKLQSLITL